jgi:hypothetical protein
MGGAQSTTNNSLKTITWRNYGDISDAAKLKQNLNTYLENELGKGYDTPIKTKVDPKDANLQKILDDQKARNGGLTDEEVMKIIGKYPSFNGNYRIPAEKRILPNKPTYVNPEPYFIIDPNAQQNTITNCDPATEVWDSATQQCVPIPPPAAKPDPELDRLQELKDEIDNIFAAFQKEQNVSSILSGSFEQNLKFYIRDDVFMKYAGDTLKKLKTEVNIGTEVADISTLDADPAKGPLVKKEVAEELTNYYVTKLNIMAHILSLIDYINNKVRRIKSGPICMAPNNQLLQHTTIDYNLPVNAAVLGANANLVGTDPKPVFDFTKDLEDIRKQILGNIINADGKLSEDFIFKKDDDLYKSASGSSTCTIDPAVLDQLKEMVENTKFLTAIELNTQAECENPAHPGFKWLAGEPEVFSNKMFIDETANNEWIAMYDELKKESIEYINKLKAFLLTLLITKVDPNDQSIIVYVDKPMSKTLLTTAVSDARNIIIMTLIAFDYAYLKLYKTPMKSLNSTNPNEAEIKKLEAELAKLKGVASLTCPK